MKLIDTIIKIVTVIALLGLLGSYTAPYVNPNVFPLSSLLGLAYHYLLISNIILLSYWIFRWKRMAFASLLTLLCGYPYMMTYYGMNPKEKSPPEYDLSILSYNVRQLDIYNWSNDPGSQEKLINYIRRFPCDIVCLQDFPEHQKYIDIFPEYRYTHQKGDLRILSHCPIIHRGTIDFKAGESATTLFCDIVKGSDTLRIYSTHLESYRFGKEDRQLFLELGDLKREDLSEGVRSVISHLVAANKVRAGQAKLLKKHLESSPYPVILCGDFNDTPISYTYTILEKNMTDAFIEKGRGVGNTYIGEFPSFRIDHILVSPSLQVVAYSRDTLQLSDHYPISARIRIP